MTIESVFYLTKFCNFRCTYCYKEDQLNENVLTENRLKIAIDDFKKIKNIDKFHLRIRGGEFSLKKETLNLIEKLFNFLNDMQQKNISVTFGYSTNLAGTEEYFLKMLNIFKKYNIPVHTDFSIHSEYYDKNKINKIINKINFITSNYPNATYRVVFDNFDLEKYPKKNLKESFNNINKNIPFKFSNTYGLFLEESRKDYNMQVLIDEKILPLINNKRISTRKFISLNYE